MKVPVFCGTVAQQEDEADFSFSPPNLRSLSLSVRAISTTKHDYRMEKNPVKKGKEIVAGEIQA